jgi:chromosome segregation ATPase
MKNAQLIGRVTNTNIAHSVAKTTRLRARRDEIAAQLEEVERPFREVQAGFSSAVALATANIKKRKSSEQRAERKVSELDSEIAELQAKLNAKLGERSAAAARSEKAAAELVAASKALEDVLAEAQKAAEPSRHAAALRKDLESVQRRLDLHMARYPEPTLVLTSEQNIDEEPAEVEVAS